MTPEIIKHGNRIISELEKFSIDILALGEPILDNRLEEFERLIGFSLPLDFKYILKKHNSFSLLGMEVIGIGEKFKASLDEVYHFEHEETGNPMFKEFLPFCNDGRGNHYCLDLSRLENDLCPIIFWQHDYYYSDKSEVETCNNNFIQWIKEVMIEDTLEYYNYDGSDKDE